MNGETTNNRKLPWQVQAIITLGVLPSITIFLILVVTGFISSPLTRSIDRSVQEHLAITQIISQSKHDQVALLQVICLSIVDPGNRKDCLLVSSDAVSR